ncbi:hypothetical protein [Halarchaeum nitratireducens]|uniref:Uncharacterized protein n=1 Tax=Halarchaeum nitratireducens TaxID=489913 RepID=A0A830G8G1_9EURY|nr:MULTISPECIES: hypothetical protein [Halarchaeum]MBP2250073.1 hypothetical protein [Halarchaeum solikamskense]GGN08651.1 hypothetical protein GCM10009021_05100 [Halarchaeum nitratireducens]
MVRTPSRRSALHATGVALAAALAGCSASDTDDGTERGRLLGDVPHATLRTTGDRPPIVAPTDDRGEPSIGTVESDADAAELSYATDALESTDVTAARRLVAETDFDHESVVVSQTAIGACYRRRLHYVALDADGDPDVQFCRVVRDAHAPCERDETDHVAALVRLPLAADEYDGYSVGSGGRCGPVPERYQNGSESP